MTRGRADSTLAVLVGRLPPWTSTLSLALCALGASWALWRRPGVYGPDEGLWWATTGTVLAAWLLVLVAFVGALRRRAWWSYLAGLAPGVALVFAGLLGRFVFPRAPAPVFVMPFVLGLAWLLTTVRAFRQLPRRSRVVGLAVALVAAPWGAVQPLARAPGPAGTRPLLTVLPEASDAGALSARGTLELDCGGARLSVAPLLEFLDASEDGFWPVASTDLTRALIGRPTLAGPGARARFQANLDGGRGTFEATTLVPSPVASHLNHFTKLVLTGLSAPALRLSPLPEPLPLLPYDYPSGRPAHFAALTASLDLVAWRASDAEKGPFFELARARVSRETPLTLTFLDGDTPKCRLTFADFFAQADVSRSPTAGEGVPVNVVQFGRSGATGEVVVFLSLAATGIGAGLETVVHREGVYRNRVRVDAD